VVCGCSLVVEKSGKWKVESGKWKVESGKWKVESGKFNPMRRGKKDQ